MNNPAFEIELKEVSKENSTFIYSMNLRLISFLIVVLKIQSNDIYTKKLRSCSKKPTLATIPSGVPLEFIDPELPMELGLEVDKVKLSTINEVDGSGSIAIDNISVLLVELYAINRHIFFYPETIWSEATAEMRKYLS